MHLYRRKIGYLFCIWLKHHVLVTVAIQQKNRFSVTRGKCPECVPKPLLRRSFMPVHIFVKTGFREKNVCVDNNNKSVRAPKNLKTVLQPG